MRGNAHQQFLFDKEAYLQFRKLKDDRTYLDHYVVEKARLEVNTEEAATKKLDENSKQMLMVEVQKLHEEQKAKQQQFYAQTLERARAMTQSLKEKQSQSDVQMLFNELNLLKEELADLKKE